MPLVETESLSKRYGPLTALDDCTLTVEPGEVFGLLGPNGSGKSTLLRLLLGFLRPTSGRARIAGLDCQRNGVAVRRRVAYLPGDVRLFRRMRADDVLRFLAGLRAEGNLDRARRLARRLDLDLSRVVARMSTGTRQKLALAAVLSSAAPLVILDEPTSNLDPTVRGEVAALVREARDAGRTVLFSSHILEEVEQVCDRVAVLRAGRLVHEQPLDALRRQHWIRARLVGPPPRPPAQLAGELELRVSGERLVILARGPLGPVLGWLSTLALDELTIEPVGLRAVYEQFHPSRVA